MKRYLIYFLPLLVVNCLGEGATSSSVGVPVGAPQFSYPDIPAMITDPNARLSYFTEHYWDDYNFADSLLINNDSISGSAIAGYISLMELSDSATLRTNIHKVLDRAMCESYDNFLEFNHLLENYLYDPNSPLRNEELYIPILEYLTQNERIDPMDKLRPESQLKIALKNRVGALSTDFEYTLKNGEKRMMHAIDSRYTILFFNSPDCEECARVKSYMLSSSAIVDGHDSGELQILALYPDSDVALWRGADYDSIIINSYDDGQQITHKSLYDLRAIPTLYLLDNEKRVVLKDCTIEQIDRYLHEFL